MPNPLKVLFPPDAIGIVSSGGLHEYRLETAGSRGARVQAQIDFMNYCLRGTPAAPREEVLVDQLCVRKAARAGSCAKG